MTKNIQFDSQLSDESKMVYLMTYKENGKTARERIAITATNIDEASLKFKEAMGEAEITKIEKISRTEYRRDKLK